MANIFHKYLNDRQYRFCELYAFGLPLNNYFKYVKYQFRDYEPFKYLEIEEEYKPLHYRNKDNILEYLYNNATGSYYKAYGCSYKVAKANGCRLLKDPKIKKELAYMFEFIKRNEARGLYRSYAKADYISPDSNLYDIFNNKEDKEKFLKAWRFKKS